MFIRLSILLLLSRPTAFILIPHHARLSALKSTLLYCPTNSTTKKDLHFPLSAISRLMVLSGFLLSDSVEREHQLPWYFAGILNEWWVQWVLTQTMPQSNITVICSKFGECPQRLFCLFFDYKSWHISSCGAKWKRWGGEGLKIKSEIPIFLRICLARHFFRYIISMCDEIIITLSASYFENILNCYKSELLFNFLKIRVA